MDGQAWLRQEAGLAEASLVSNRPMPSALQLGLTGPESIYVYLQKYIYTYRTCNRMEDRLSLRELRLQSNHAFCRDPAWAQPPHPHCPYKWKILCFLISELVHLWVFRCKSPTIGGSDVFYSYSNLWFLPPLDRFSWLVLYIFLYLLLNTSFFSLFLNPTYSIHFKG